MLPLGTNFKSTHGSGWIIQMLSNPNLSSPSNPTNGSWWIVQILPKRDLKYPPTAVGGITVLLLDMSVERI